MARVPYLDKSDLAPGDQDLLQAQHHAAPRARPTARTACRAFGGLGQFIRHKSRLDPRLRELAILQVGYLARAPYEWSHHVKIGRDFGVTDDDIRALIAETEGKSSKLEPLAKLVLKAAREMTNDLAISEATFAALRKDLDNERIVDLVITISFYNAVVRLLASLQIDVEPEYQPYLEEFPLARCRHGQVLMSDAGKTAATPRPAATVVILRDGREGLEVFMVVRHHEIDFASGALVFPGGKVDPDDADPAWDVLAPSAASAPDRAFLVAAARETFEEAGLMLARRGGGTGHGRGRRCAPAGRDLPRASARGRYDLPRSRAQRGPAARHRSDGAVRALDHARRRAQALRHAFSPGSGADEPARRPRRRRVGRGPVDRAAAGLARGGGRHTHVGVRHADEPAKLARYATVADAVAATRTSPIVTVTPRVERTATGRTLHIPAEAGYGVTEFAVPMPKR